MKNPEQRHSGRVAESQAPSIRDGEAGVTPGRAPVAPDRIVPPFGRTYQASSASFLSQADMPLGLAFRLYSAFSAFVQRTWICSVARSLAGKVGLPRFLVVVIARIIAYTNNPCNPSLGMI